MRPALKLDEKTLAYAIELFTEPNFCGLATIKRRLKQRFNIDYGEKQIRIQLAEHGHYRNQQQAYEVKRKNRGVEAI